MCCKNQFWTCQYVVRLETSVKPFCNSCCAKTREAERHQRSKGLECQLGLQRIILALSVGCRLPSRSPKTQAHWITKLLRRLGADMEAATGLPCPLWHRGLALHVAGAGVLVRSESNFLRHQERAEKNGAALACLADS